ncbi:MAG TPA: hypothetical protein VFV54_04825 [Thermoanaerobaculia bacterium]|nr:hypothetical protein [Thermoanaerobaculia bacterium]
MGRHFALSLCALFLAGCATAAVDLDEPRRILGTEGDVRVDAQVFAEKIGTGSSVRVVWEIENQRRDPIAVADILPAVSYEPTDRTIVVNVGSEVPGNEMLPRLIRIEPGERKTFEGLANIALRMPAPGPLAATPRLLSLKLNFLSNVAPFQALVGIPEVAVRDPERADNLFTTWVEANETVRTNAIPIEWLGTISPTIGTSDTPRRPSERSRP